MVTSFKNCGYMVQLFGHMYFLCENNIIFYQFINKISKVTTFFVSWSLNCIRFLLWGWYTSRWPILNAEKTMVTPLENCGYMVQFFGCMYFSCADAIIKEGTSLKGCWVKWFLMKTTEDVLWSIGVLFLLMLRPWSIRVVWIVMQHNLLFCVDCLVC